AGAQGMEFQFRDQAFETEEEPAIGSRRVVNALLIADETMPVATEVEELVPVGAVAGQAGDILGEGDGGVAGGDLGCGGVKGRARGGGAAGEPQVSVDDVNASGVPAAGAGALAQGILEFKTLDMVDNLVRAGLADVDEGLAAEVLRLNQFGRGHGKP